MDRITAVKALIERHTEAATYHIDKVNELKAYLYDLTKPGFNSRGWRRVAVKRGRTEPYLVQANSETVTG